MPQLVQQRIRYLVEYGGLYPPEEPASKNFVVKWLTVILVVNLIQLALMMLR